MTLDELLQLYTGLLSRMKERDGNNELAAVIDQCFMDELKSI